MKQAQTIKIDNSWGVVPVGASKVPVRWIVMWIGIAGWLAVTLVCTGGPTAITALALNISFLIGLILIGGFTRSIPARTIGLMFFSGAVMMGVALLIEQAFAVPAMESIRPLMTPFLEEVLKLVPLFVFFARGRKFTIWTLGVTDVMLMGAASGAGFAFVFDAFKHSSTAWVHHLQWLPTADYVNWTHLIAGNAAWSAIAGGALGLALAVIHNRKAAISIALAGFIYVVIDHTAAVNYNSPNPVMASFFSMVTAHGFATPYILIAVAALAVFLDSWIKLRWFPKASEFKLPKRGDSTAGLGGLWDFILDRRRLANANFKRMHQARNSYASMAVAILSQSLINHHSPPKMTQLFAQMGMNVGDTLALLPDGTVDTPDDPFASLDLPDHYELIRRISIGGMGAIYRARHTKTNAFLAIKILHAHVADVGNNRQRFDLEAKAAAALKHPNLVVVHDYGITNKKIPYLVMELIEGTTLQDEFGRLGGLPPGRFFYIFDQVCAALIHAHSRGVIHRDIKPSNILIVNSVETPDLVKVVDFGIAKVIDPRGAEAQDLTQTGDILGSPLYMSPEQCMGERLDARTDVYSLGCVMYQAITGKPPIMAENVVKTIFKHVNVVPDPIAVAKPGVNVPLVIEQIIFRSLEKKPSNRFASMEELKNALISARQSIG
ncbi:MAG: protein kinase [Candidatus Melainabacteria bacterium]|nr:protein kinase [Candidatus Melainabacteria bacterium]